MLRQLREILREPASLLDRLPAGTSAEARSRTLEGLVTLDRVWDHLVPGEKERLARLLVESVTVSPDGIELVLRADGLDAVLAEVADGEGESESGSNDATEVTHA